MTSSQQLKLGALMSYFAIGINILTGLLYTPWMIHSIGRENFGLYTLAMSVISLFVFDFGLSAAVTRFIAKYLAEGRQDKADNCLGLIYRLYIIIDGVLILVLFGVYFFIPQLYKELTPNEIESFKIVFVIAAIYSVISFPFIPVNGVLTAHEKFIQLKLCDIAHKLIIVTAMSGCLLLGGGLYALVSINAIAGIIMICLKIVCIKKFTKDSQSKFEFFAAGIVVNALLALLTTFFLPGASFLFLWPALIGSVSLIVNALFDNYAASQVVLSLNIVIMLLFAVPLLYSFFLALSIGGLAVLNLLLVIMLAVVLPSVFMQFDLKRKSI